MHSGRLRQQRPPHRQPSETQASKRFITFIDSNTYQILGEFVIDGTNGKPLTSGGIEQCQWSPRTGKFYININLPGGSGSDTTLPLLELRRF
jgi:hypothetical protein